MDSHPSKQFYALKDLVEQLYELTASETIDVGEYSDRSMELVGSIAGIIHRMPEPPWVWQIKTDVDFLFVGTRTDAIAHWREAQRQSGQMGSLVMHRAPTAKEAEAFEFTELFEQKARQA